MSNEWLSRVLEEATELAEMISKLSQFIHTENYKSLNLIQQTLLDRQRMAMLEYYDILVQRMNTASFDPTPSDEDIQERIDFLTNRF